MSEKKQPLPADGVCARYLTFKDGSVRLEEPYSERELAGFICKAEELHGSATLGQATKTLPEIWDLYSDQRKQEDGWSAKTLQEMHIPVERYQRYCDDNKLDPFLESTTADYPMVLLAQKTKRAMTMSVATVNQHLDRIRAAFRWAVDRGYAPANHFAKLKIKIGARAKAARGKSRRPYTYAEVEQVLSVLDPTSDPRHWAILIGMFSGCRISEVAQLYCNDIEEEAGIAYIHVREGRPHQRVKGHKPRKVPIHSELIRRGLLDWVSCLRLAGHERLFSEFTPGRDGYGQSCSKWYNRTFKAAHAIPKDFHSYRHTMQSALGAAGVPQRAINAILGHSAGKSMSMTSYEHGLPLPDLRDAINKLPMNPGRTG